MSVQYKSYEKQTLNKIDKGIFRALSAVGAFVEAQAVQIITENPNVDSGRLRGSITYDVNGVGSSVNGHFPGDKAKSSDKVQKSSSPYTVNIGSNVEYAARIEFIGGKGKPVGFLRKAVNDFRPSIQRIFQGELKKV